MSKVSWFNKEEFSVLDLAQWLEKNHQDIKSVACVMIYKDGEFVPVGAGKLTNLDVSHSGNILIDRAING